MNDTVIILKQSSLDELRKAIPENIERYQSPNPEWEEFFGNENYTRATSVEIVGTDFGACLGDNFDSKTILKEDPERCKSIYNALANLTPQQATDDRVWAYLTHFVFWDYTRARWPIGTDRKQQVSKIRAHFFGKGIRGMVRDNAISRLWWMAFVCSRLKKHSLIKSLEALLYKEDVRKEIMERATFSRSVPIFKSIMKFMLLSYENNKELHERENFRNMSKQINRIGGMRVLDALEEDDLNKLIEGIIQKELKIDTNFPKA